MPDIGFISEKAKAFTDSHIQEILDQSDTMEDFQLTLKNNLSEHLLTFYGKPEIVQNCVAKQVEKNLTAQDVMNNYFPSDITDKKISPTDAPEAHELLSIFDSSLENTSMQTISTLHTTQQKFIDALDNNLDKNNLKLEDSWKTLLGNAKNDLGADKTNQHRGTQLLSCMKKFAPEGKLNLEDMGAFVTVLEK